MYMYIMSYYYVYYVHITYQKQEFVFLFYPEAIRGHRQHINAYS